MNTDTNVLAGGDVFLLPLAVLFAAIALASTEGLRFGISLVGAIISAAWLVRVGWWPDLSVFDRCIAGAIASAWVIAWAVASVMQVRELLRQRKSRDVRA